MLRQRRYKFLTYLMILVYSVFLVYISCCTNAIVPDERMFLNIINNSDY